MKTEANCFLVCDAALDDSIRNHKSEFFSGWFLERRNCSCIAVAEVLKCCSSWSCRHLPLSSLYSFLE